MNLLDRFIDDVRDGLAAACCRLAGHRWVPSAMFGSRYLAGEWHCDRCHVFRPTWAGIAYRNENANRAFVDNMARLAEMLRDR